MPSRQATHFTFTIYGKQVRNQETGKLESPIDIPEEEIQEIKSIELGTFGLKYLLFQHERTPTTRREHLQGYLWVAKKKTAHAIKVLLGRNDAHIEICAGTAGQNIEYCTKLKSKITDKPLYELGDQPEHSQGNRSDLQSAYTMLKDGTSIWKVADAHLKPVAKHYSFFKAAAVRYAKKRNWKPTVTVYWGATGAGKSTRVRNEESDEDIYSVDSGNPKWFDGYDGHEVVLLDDFHHGWVPITDLLNILGKFSCRRETKGSHTQLLCKRIYITTNYHPREWYPSVPAKSRQALKNRIDYIIECKRDPSWGPRHDCDPTWIIPDDPTVAGERSHVCGCPSHVHFSWCPNNRENWRQISG